MSPRKKSVPVKKQVINKRLENSNSALPTRTPSRKQVSEQSSQPKMNLRTPRQRASTLKVQKRTLYDASGKLTADGRDLCDCLRENCPGCFYSCRKCGSNKCGVECRCFRKWKYEDLAEDGGETRPFPENEQT